MDKLMNTPNKYIIRRSVICHVYFLTRLFPKSQPRMWDCYSV